MKYCYLTLSFLIFATLLCNAQTDSAGLSTIVSKLQKLTVSHPVEKVYLQLNKPNYTQGDTIWFKAYITAGDHHQPSVLSGVLYVELINNHDKIIKTVRLKNSNGILNADIAISDSLQAGDYRIRAYTNWMRNVGPDYFFIKTINIGNTRTGAVFITSSAETPAEGMAGAKLTYTDKFGRPFDYKSVTYEVKADTATIYKGKGITDENGLLSIAFADKMAGGQKRLNVVNHIALVKGITVDKTIPISLKSEHADVQFFPEGGQLVSEVRSRVAFKAIGTNGLGVDIKGVVLDNDNKEVAYLSSQHAGMGIFFLVPQAGKTYTAKITMADKSTFVVKLPTVAEKGFVLAVNSADSTMLNVRVVTNNATLKEKLHGMFYLVGQSAGMVFYTTVGKLENLATNASVPKNKFPSGIAQFTLFSATNEPLNERVIFIRNSNDLLDLNLKTGKQTYATKEKVDMTFKAKYNNDKPAKGSFSLSVINEDRLTANENAETTILTNVLLTSDLKGYIEEPNYYFNQVNDETKTNLDILMMTQGFRRFEWKDIIADRYPALNFLPEKFLSISGMLTNGSNKPLDKAHLRVFSLIDKLSIDTVTNAEGKFDLPDMDFDDGTKLVIQARKSNDGRNVNISLNNGTVPIVYKNDLGALSASVAPPYSNNTLTGVADTTGITNATRETIAKTSASSLKEVTIKGKKMLPPNIYNNYGNAYQFSLDMDKAKDYNSVFEMVQNRVPGVKYAGEGRLTYEDSPVSLAIVNGREFGIS